MLDDEDDDHQNPSRKVSKRKRRRHAPTRRTVARGGRSAFEILDGAPLKLQVDGVTRKLSADEAIQLQIYARAVAGDKASIRAVLRWIEEREAAWPVTQRAVRMKILFETRDYKNVDEAIELLGIAEPDAGLNYAGRRGFRLSSALVNYALANWPGVTWSSKDRVEVEEHCKDPDQICWPEEVGDE